MNKFKLIILIIIVATGIFTFNSCRTNETIDPNADIPNLGGYDYPRTALDDWLDANYLDPYNIKVIYHWDAVYAYSSSLGSTITPVQIDKVQPMMSALANVWFKPYKYAAPDGFLQKFTPKTIILVGSPEYSSNGTTETLGEAEGATMIFLTNANAFNASNAIGLKKYLHVIEHEFVHILCQNVVMPPAYKSITSQYYNPTGWQNYSSADSLTKVYQLGFITAYSMTSPEEDFAEIVSNILVYGLDNFKNTILPLAAASKTNPNAAANLQQKLNLAVQYYYDNYKINFYDDPAKGTTGLINYVQQAVTNEVNSHQ